MNTTATSGIADGILSVANSPSSAGLGAINNAANGNAISAHGNMVVFGNLSVTGTKSSVQEVETPEGPRAVVYSAVESATSHTEVSGVGQLTNGTAEIALPDDFA